MSALKLDSIKLSKMVRKMADDHGILAVLHAIRQGLDDAITQSEHNERSRTMREKFLAKLNALVSETMEESHAHCHAYDVPKSPMTIGTGL